MTQKKHIKLGDSIKVISGKQKGTIGKITSIQTKRKTVGIDTIPNRTKMTKQKDAKNPQKQDIPILLSWSNVMLWDETERKASRIGYQIIDGKKYRYLKKSGKIV